MSLPTPSADALEISSALNNAIRDEIAAQNGWISFAQYMSHALYMPQLGYYSGGARKFGKDGDFTTAPELTPIFGATLAEAVETCLAQTSPELFEFGAGTGKLAYDLLSALSEKGIRLARYTILELSAELRTRQQETLKDYPEVTWIAHLPDAFSGIVIGNEVLDAMPVQLVIKRETGWRELGVAVVDGQFVYEERDVSKHLLSRIHSQIAHHALLPLGYMTEVHTHAAAFMHSVSSMIKKGDGGAAFFFDYGFPSKEYYLADRARGTLMCHYRHHAHGDPFYLPGLQDITAHLDFSELANIADQHHLDILLYTSQSAFLLAAGIDRVLLRTSPDNAATFLPQANAAQTLLSASEMGELFKVLVIGKGVELPDHFDQYDRTVTL